MTIPNMVIKSLPSMDLNSPSNTKLSACSVTIKEPISAGTDNVVFMIFPIVVALNFSHMILVTNVLERF